MNTANKLVLWASGLLVLGAVGIGSVGDPARSQSPQTVKVDGSSTVYPISAAIAKAFQATPEGQDVTVSVEFSGTGGGFKKFCAGQTDINDASRPISTAEMEVCRKAGISFLELPVAFDALTVVVNPKNSAVSDITVTELKKLWEPAAQGKITRWNQVRASWPNQPIKLYGPGKDSGTFDYFSEVTMGKVDASRTDYVASEDDEVLVKGVSQEDNALGYFGIAYYEANKDKLKALAVDSGMGAILPSREAVEKAKYQPYSRPLLIYVNAQAIQKNPKLAAFVKFYFNQGEKLVSSVGYIPLPEEGYRLGLQHFYVGKVGTVFNGVPQPNLTIGELLRKETSF